MRKKIAVGILLGLTGALCDVLVWQFTGRTAIYGLRDAFLISATLFFGPVAGVTALLLGGAGRLAMVFYGTSLLSGLMGLAGSFLAFVSAALFGRWMFFRERPPALAAALFAVICALAQPFVRLLFSFVGVEVQASVLIEGIIWSGSAAAVLAAVLSLLLRVPQRVKLNGVAAMSAAVLAALVIVVALTQGAGAVRQAEERAQVLKGDAATAVDYPIEPELLHVARVAVMKYGTVEKLAASGACTAIAQENDYVFVAAVGRDGRVLSASRPGAVGFDFDSDEFTREYLALNKDESYYSMPFNAQPAAFGDGTDFLCKYVGVAFPGGGFVFIGESLANLAFRDYLLREMMINWHVGKSGSLLLANPKTERVLSAYDYDKIGMSLKDAGFGSLRFSEAGGLARGMIFGVDTFVYRQPLDFVPLDVYILMPADDVLSSRDLSVVFLLVIVSFIYGFGATLFAKITKQGRDLAVLRAKEDALRKRDLQLAKDIQASALPSVFRPFGSCSDFGLYAHMRTAKEVGGDFFDFYPVGRRKLCLVIADVSDKGVPAAMFMMKSMAIIRAEMLHTPSDLPSVMAAVNDALVANNTADMFVTTWLGVYDLDTGVIESVSAGHNPPFLRRTDGTVVPVVNPRGLVVGGISGVRYKTASVTLAPGDSLLLYTDGVTEATDGTGAFFGEERLAATLSACGQDPRETCEKVFKAVDAFANSTPQADDITVMTLTRCR